MDILEVVIIGGLIIAGIVYLWYGIAHAPELGDDEEYKGYRKDE
jgi:hypothetical protein